MKVCKFGGSSLADAAQVTKVRDIVLADPDRRLVVVSAPGKRNKADQEKIDAQTKADKAGLPGSVMISDAFFPYRDGADVGIRQGVSAILQAGGSMRDFETIQACNEASPQVAMKFTGQRSFKH